MTTLIVLLFIAIVALSFMYVSIAGRQDAVEAEAAKFKEEVALSHGRLWQEIEEIKRGN